MLAPLRNTMKHALYTTERRDDVYTLERERDESIIYSWMNKAHARIIHPHKSVDIYIYMYDIREVWPRQYRSVHTRDERVWNFVVHSFLSLFFFLFV